jgi:lysine biosynthesis protein LysW
MATCPECDAEIDVEDDDLDEMEIGDPWDCDACGTRLRVASVDPMEFESDDDEDDEDEEEEEEELKEDADEDADEDDDVDDDAGGDWEE